MSSYETSINVGGQGEIHLPTVPFQPGTEVDVIVSVKAAESHDPKLRLTALLSALDRAHNDQRVGSLRREELYDRNGVH